MSVSTKNATLPKSTKLRNSNPAVLIQIQSQSRFEFVPQDTEGSEILQFGGFSISVVLHFFKKKMQHHRNGETRKIPRNLGFSISVVLHFFHEHVHFF